MQAGKTDSFQFTHHSHALVTLYVQLLSYDWSKFDRWVHAEDLCSILNLVLYRSAEADRVLCQLVTFLMSFFTGCTKWNTAAIKSLLLLMAGLFIEFWVEKCHHLSKSKIRFRMASFRFLTLLDAGWKVSQAILALLYSFQELHLEW